MNKSTKHNVVESQPHTRERVRHAKEQKKKEIREGQVAEEKVGRRVHFVVATHNVDHQRVGDESESR